MDLFSPFHQVGELQLETTFTVNYLHQFALVYQMLEIPDIELRRVVFVTSYSPFLFATSKIKMKFKDLILTQDRWHSWPPLASPLEAYANSKVAGIAAAREISRRYPNIVAVSVHPGLIIGKLGVPRIHDSDPWYVKLYGWGIEYGTWMFWSSMIRVKNAEQGSANQVWAAMSNEVDQWPGAYFESYKKGPLPPVQSAGDDELAKEVWEESVRLIGSVPSNKQNTHHQQQHQPKLVVEEKNPEEEQKSDSMLVQIPSSVARKRESTREPYSSQFMKISFVKDGTGPFPIKGQMVTVHCTGYGKNGRLEEKFWSTKDPGQKEFTFQIGMGTVIRAWDEGVMKLQVGSIAQILSSPLYAYGQRGFPAFGILPDSALLFDIEVLKIDDVKKN
jgi:peptidylprolyl isomerase